MARFKVEQLRACPGKFCITPKCVVTTGFLNNTFQCLAILRTFFSPRFYPIEIRTAVSSPFGCAVQRAVHCLDRQKQFGAK